MKPATSWGERVERGRDTAKSSHTCSNHGDDFGFFFLRPNADIGRDTLRVMVSAGDESMRWEHVSVSLPNRCPTWEEMSWVKSLFWTDEETVVEYHPPKADYVSFHPFYLHLWRPIDVDVPRPPTVAVGPVGTAMHGLAVPR